MPATFEDARVPVSPVALDLIREVETHGWLAQYRMAYVFRAADKLPDHWGKARVLSGIDKHLSGGVDAALIIERRAWTILDAPRQRALVDHLLSHFGMTEDGDLCLVKPDVAEFASVIARHGLWRAELERMADAIAMRPHALGLDLDADPMTAVADVEDETEDREQAERDAAGTLQVSITAANLETIRSAGRHLRAVAGGR